MPPRKKTDHELTQDLLRRLIAHVEELKTTQKQIMMRMNAIEMGIANEAFLAEERVVTVTVGRN